MIKILTDEEEKTLLRVKAMLLDADSASSTLRNIIGFIVEAAAEGCWERAASQVAHEIQTELKYVHPKWWEAPLPLEEAIALFDDPQGGTVPLRFDDKLGDGKVLLFHRKNDKVPYRGLEELIVGEGIKLPYTSFVGRPDDFASPFDHYICDDCDESFDDEEEVVEHWLTTHLTPERFNAMFSIAIILAKDEVTELLPELRQAKRYWDGWTFDGKTLCGTCT